MNITDLRREFDRQALDSADPGEVMAEAGRRLAAHTRRRRTQSLIAVAAAVLVVAGGASAAGALLVHGSAGPAASGPIAQVSQVPVPADTTLVSYQLQPVQTPVTATAPSKLTGQEWLTSPGRLGVSFFYPHADSRRPPYGTTSADTWVQQRVGYVITDMRTDTLQRGGILPSTAVSHKDITVGGHAATLDTAPAATDDTFGFPADRRISWQLTDGRWIHVWTSGLGKDVLTDFAATITERPHLLDRTVRIGLSLPGLTADSSINSPAGTGFVALCPPGVDPMAIPPATSPGSTSNPPGTGMNQAQTNSSSSSRCITAEVGSGSASLPGPTTKITVGNTVAHVDTAGGAAWVDLGHHMTAVVTAPASSHLSTADLAALVASVRVSPTAILSPVQTPQDQGHGQELSGVATASTPPPPSTHN